MAYLPALGKEFELAVRGLVFVLILIRDLLESSDEALSRLGRNGGQRPLTRNVNQLDLAGGEAGHHKVVALRPEHVLDLGRETEGEAVGLLPIRVLQIYGDDVQRGVEGQGQETVGGRRGGQPRIRGDGTLRLTDGEGDDVVKLSAFVLDGQPRAEVGRLVLGIKVRGEAVPNCTYGRHVTVRHVTFHLITLD